MLEDVGDPGHGQVVARRRLLGDATPASPRHGEEPPNVASTLWAPSLRARRRREGAHQASTGHRGPQCPAGDPLCHLGAGIPLGRTPHPPARSRKVRSTLGWQNAWSACSTLHENVGCYGNTALSIPVLGYLCSGEEGRACQSRTSSTQLAAFPFSTVAPGCRGGHQHLAPLC